MSLLVVISGRYLLRVLFPLTALLWMMAFSPAPARADGAGIRDLLVNNTGRDLLLFFRLENAFLPEMEEGIVSGIPATFTFYVDLREKGLAGFGPEIASLEFEHTLSYDSLKNEFSVQCSQSRKRMTVSSLAEGKTVMCRVDGVRVVELARLKPGITYGLRVKARLERKTLPSFFHYLIPFWPLQDFETDWYHVEFKF